MRVIHSINSIADSQGGPTYSIRRLCENLEQSGIGITLATLDDGPVSGSLGYVKRFRAGLGPARLGRCPEMRRWIESEVRLGKADLLHSHSLWMLPNVYPGQIATELRVPYVASPRGTFTQYSMSSGSRIKRVFWPLVQKPALRAVTCFHATADSECDDIRRLGFRQPIAVIPIGVDIPPYARSESRTERTLLFVGRVHEEKGIANLLKAWHAIEPQFRDWVLRVVGPDGGGHLPRMKALASELKLERAEFRDAIYGNRKWDAYSSADLFVLPSPSENFGVSIAEALAAGTPVVTTQGAPWSGLLEHRAGWWIEYGVEQLVDCLRVAMSVSRQDLNFMGRRGRDWMERDFAWNQITNAMIETYAWVLGISARPSCIVDQ